MVARQFSLLIMLLSLLAACSERTPPIAQGLAKGLAPMEIRGVFNERIKLRFPVGYDEAQLLTEIRKERFKVSPNLDPASPYRFSALYESHSLVCKDSWTVQWSARQGKITAIEGRFGQVCL